MKRTAIYCRVSTSQQGKEGDSIPAQLDALRRYIAEHDDLTPAGEFIDAGISGTKEQRDELQRMLSAVRAKEIDLIIITKMDRLHRSLRNFLNMQDVLDKHGCNWLAIWEPMYDTSTPQGRMIINSMMNLAQFEAENTGARIKQVFAYKAERGEVLSGKTPLGYDIVNKRLTPNADADLAREIFAFYDRTNSMRETTKFMAAHGVNMVPRSLKQMLRNKKYIGVFRNNDEYCEPIIDRELFDRVQTALSRNIKASAIHEYIFTGLVYCPECGKKLAPFYHVRRPRNRPQSYVEIKYRCPRHYARPYPRCSFNGQIPEQRIEKWLLNNVNALVDDLVIEQKQKQSEGRRNAQKAMTLQRKQERLKAAYLNGVISLSEFREDRERIAAEIDALNASEPARTVLNPALNKVFGSDFKTVYDGLTVPEKRRLWRSVLERIIVDDTWHFRAVFL